ncbi:hypothetical protein MH117_03775 [Paenibacillus sp. ACRRX]|uniref:hypothetical protein n=1 Tax=unclassified Paenibacillus TaxID=185978 RepID=UPI001EF444A8|nr:MULTISPECIES: hypothetical protein [unclassified Paenibacillus]MCG7406524.1 hypothetical protein [Paenibacillus sp. ACRRX]MDK8179556.1 hypothetical protein [Paenibacillus sp. UMB4589-SE434]
MKLRKELEPINRTDEFKNLLKSKIEQIELLLESGKTAFAEIEEFNKLTGREYDEYYFSNYWRSISIDDFVNEASNPYPVKMNEITKDELIELVRRILDIETYGNDTSFYLEVLTANMMMPDISDLIYYQDLSPEEIIEEGLKYKPIIL